MKSVYVHAALAALGLGVAYATWTRGADVDHPAEEVTLLDCAPADLHTVALEDEQHRVVITRADGAPATYRVSVTPKSPASTTSSEPPPHGQEFVGNPALESWIEANVPLRALRSLGTVPAARLAELELSAPKTHFDIACGSRRASYVIGGAAYGSGERYARLASGGPVVLLGSAVVADLQAAESRFMQRELHRFSLNDIDEVVVHVADHARTLRQMNRQAADAHHEWVDAAAPDRRNELFGNWLERVEALRATEYLPAHTEPGHEPGASAGSPVHVALLEYTADGQSKGRLELVRIDQPQGPVYYARTEATHDWVKVVGSVGTQVDGDARPVVGLEAISPPTGASTPAGATTPAAAGTPAGVPGAEGPTAPPHATNAPTTLPSVPSPSRAVAPRAPGAPASHGPLPAPPAPAAPVR